MVELELSARDIFFVKNGVRPKVDPDLDGLGREARSGDEKGQ